MSQVLHPIEQKILKTLIEKQNLTPQELSDKTQLSIDQIRRGIEWLRLKDLISVQEIEKNFVTLGPKGIESAKNGLPERLLVDYVKSLPGSSCTLEEARNQLKVEFNAAIANARKNGWVDISENKIILKTSIDDSSEEKLIKQISDSKDNAISINEINDIKSLEFLKKRPDFLVVNSIKSITIDLKEKGKESMSTFQLPHTTDSNLRAIDVEAPAPAIFAARSHPLRDVIDEVREIFVSLGFSEIIGNNVQTSFWNFDALFTPQDHPAREMQDTFYLKDVTASTIAKPDQIKKVSEIHKKGWNYQWQNEEAKKLVLRTHTTCVTIRALADQKHDNARLFSIGRVFRNEKLSYKHLAEFHQVEGVVVGKSVTLQDLMGLQTEFYHKMGIKKIKFWPTFFPYTEPSLQSMIYNEKLGKWVELFGMGIFRPEVTKPLGIKNPVLAWGGGIERIAMLRYSLEDVRELYENKFGWLRSVPKCQ
jgi:phenylalanyl-tRNA synthetase alpha chain